MGKTVVSAALVRRAGAGARYWKPIQTGIEQDDDTAEVERLSGVRAVAPLPGSVRLERPVSPHLAARWAGRRLAVEEVVVGATAQADGAAWIVEGAGGVLVPINEAESMLDLMVALALPVVVAARTALGTINHTWLTLDAIRARGLTVAGVVLVGAPNADNRDAIAHYARVPVLGELPILDPLSAMTLGRWADTLLDPDGRLREVLG